jgi:DUF4097 and DUF4098 domain-containing protein YvlB
MGSMSEGHTFEGVTRLEIDTDAAAVRLDVAEGATTTVALTDRNGNLLDELLEVTQDGEVLRAKVRVVRGGMWKRNRKIDARLAVTAPITAAATVKTNAGSVKVDRREAPVTVKANVGSVELVGVRGDVELRTDAGSIKAIDCIGSVTASSDAGAITLERQHGERIDLRASAGSITGKALEVAHLSASTDAGAIRIEHATPPVSVEASCTVGAATIELPRDEYEIDQQVSGLGRAKLEGLESTPGATRTVRVKSNGVGSVTVRAAAGTPAHA